MYNKLFTKILDSSVWLEPTPTRIVWVTFIACMDQDGMVALSSIGNVASRARVTDKEATDAIRCLESPDKRNPDQEHEGKRVERIPGLGWQVLNSRKYRDIVTAETVRAQNRERARRHRAEASRSVTVRHENVTPSEAEAVAEAQTQERVRVLPILNGPTNDTAERAARFIERYAALYLKHRKGARYAVKPHRDYAAACTLCETWPDPRLDQLAAIFLESNHEFAENGSRTIPQFLALASWCDSRLVEWEASHK